MLLILDGWGLGENADSTLGNAIATVNPPQYQSLLETRPWIRINASGPSVGLPEGQMGNSEVGHMSLGAGRIMYQDLSRIDNAVSDGSFFDNPVLLEAINHTNTHNSTLHLMGLIGSGGVHSHNRHLLALIEMAHRHGVKKVAVHAFLDGRDTLPQSAQEPLEEIEAKLIELDYAQIQTVCGRYFAMDRDKRWDRVQQAYDNMVEGKGARHMLSTQALAFGYHIDITDEFIKPSVTDLTYEGMANNDALISFNFRPDRAREIIEALTQADFTGFEREKVIQNLKTVCMTKYSDTLGLPIAFSKETPVNALAEVISNKGLTQFRSAETEKYAHVTYFFSGGREATFPGETRKLVDSPKVATYDLQPEMSLPEVTDGVIEAIVSQSYDLLVVNFANPDMVGHTGVHSAAVKAVEAVDIALGRVIKSIEATNGTLLLTADHGNIEQMCQADGSPHTAHTTNLVPLVLVSPDSSLKLKQDDTFGLSNVAPTLLELMGIDIPSEMSSPSMLARSTVSQS